MLEIINNLFIKTGTPTDILTIKDLYKHIESCQDYNLLDKKDKRKYNQKYFLEFIPTHSNFKNSYYERKKIAGTDYRNVLVGYKKVADDTNDFDEEQT